MAKLDTILKRLLPAQADDSRADDSDADWSMSDSTGFEGSVEDAEVIGRSPMAYLAASESVGTLFENQTEQKLAKHGIENPEPDEWYPVASTLAVLYELRADYGADSMQTMGRHVPEHVKFPPDIADIKGALRSIDEAYHQNHRGGDIGSYEYQDVEEANAAHIVCANPYPCEFDQGLIKGVAKQFADSPVEVTEVGSECRAEEGPRCEYRVEWVGD